MDKPHLGQEGLVICLDVGTTQSAVSVVHLQPGQIPKIETVNRWKSDPSSTGSPKVPSLILYSHRSQPIAFGFSCVLTNPPSTSSELTGTILCRWFKLHLHPRSLEPPMYSTFDFRSTPLERVFEVPKLPKGLTVEKVYQDLLGYLVEETEEWFVGTRENGREVWDRLFPNAIFVIAHPNGWETLQQSQLSKALRRALNKSSTSNSSPSTTKSTTTTTSFDDRIVFVTEAEASVHYALQSGRRGNEKKKNDWLKPGVQFAVVDAGGSTVDTTVYQVEGEEEGEGGEEVVSPASLRLKEVKNSDCVQGGSIFPLRQARYLLSHKLSLSTNPRFRSKETIDRVLRQWECEILPNFEGRQVESGIREEEEVFELRVGEMGEMDERVGIKDGKLRIRSSEVEETFTSSINLILISLDSQLKDTTVSHILLTGGFGNSPYLQNRLRSTYSPRSIEIIMPSSSSSPPSYYYSTTTNAPDEDDHRNDQSSEKAVSIGTAIFFVTQVVVARATRFDYGTKVTITVPTTCSSSSNEKGRDKEEEGEGSSSLGDLSKRKVYTATDGKRRIRGGWERIVKRGQILEPGQMVKRRLIQDIPVGEDLNSPYQVLVCRDSILGNGRWVLDEFGDPYPGFEPCATIQIDLTPLATPSTIHTNPRTGVKYYSLEYEIGIYFGGTSLKACYIWQDNGIERRGKASIIPAQFA